MRLFIAIELNEEIQTELAKLQNKLKQSTVDVKWVAPENIHLTLKFLGNTPDDKIQKIKDILKEIAGRTSAFNISLSEIGAFPSLNSPRVIWVGTKEGVEELKKIAAALENKEFSAHITLGRFRHRCKRLVLPNFAGSAMMVSKITLFQSTLTPKGPIYTNLYEARLKPI